MRRSAHSPHLLVSVRLYAYTKGLQSARKIARQMEYEPGLEWLAGLRPINHHTLSDFHVGHGEALQELFEQVLAMLMMKGLITLERVAVDGTKIRADVNNKSFRRRGKTEAYLKLVRRHLRALERQEDQATNRAASVRGSRPRATLN